jgi:hypothetical protein
MLIVESNCGSSTVLLAASEVNPRNMVKMAYTLKDNYGQGFMSAVMLPVATQVDQDLPGVSVDLTAELRWFFDGPLPTEVWSWFTRNDAGLVEHRCDTYRLDERLDVGVKQRSGRTLELKMRMRQPEPSSVADDVNGRIETWQRWSPADGLLSLDDDAVWIDIDKTIVKRRFRTDGREQPLSNQTRAMTGDGCDVEIAALSMNGQEAWTFAFAAFGELDTHRDALGAAWRALVEQQPRPDELRLHIGRSYGYPEWIARATDIPTPTQDDVSFSSVPE